MFVFRYLTGTHYVSAGLTIIFKIQFSRLGIWLRGIASAWPVQGHEFDSQHTHKNPLSTKLSLTETFYCIYKPDPLIHSFISVS